MNTNAISLFAPILSYHFSYSEFITFLSRSSLLSQLNRVRGVKRFNTTVELFHSDFITTLPSFIYILLSYLSPWLVPLVFFFLSLPVVAINVSAAFKSIFLIFLLEFSFLITVSIFVAAGVAGIHSIILVANMLSWYRWNTFICSHPYAITKFKHYGFFFKEKCNRFSHDVVTLDVGAWRFDKRLHFSFESVFYHDD